MQPILLLLFIIIGLTVGLVLFFIIRSLIAPKKLSSLNDLLKTGRAAQAIKIAKSILAKDPRNHQAHYLLGQAYQLDNKSELALVEFKTVNQIGLFDGLVVEKDFRKKIAALYSKFGQEEEALKEYLVLIKLDPQTSDNYFNAGRLFENRGNADQALKFYRKTLDMDPKNVEALMNVGMLFFRANRHSDAKIELEQALKLNPEKYEASFYLGRIYKEAHDFNGALSFFEKSLKQPELKLKALIERGSCLLSIKNYDRAIIELERAIKLATADNEKEILFARYFLAHCYEKNRSIEKAITEWEAIYAKKPTFKDVAEKLAAYQDLRIDDHIKDYVTSSKPQYMEICEKIVQAMGFNVQTCDEIAGGIIRIVCMENDSEKWRNVKKMPKLVHFFRTSVNIDEQAMRDVVDEIRKLGANKCYMITNTGFTRAAMSFAETRPYELIGKDQLLEILKKTEL